MSHEGGASRSCNGAPTSLFPLISVTKLNKSGPPPSSPCGKACGLRTCGLREPLAEVSSSPSSSSLSAFISEGHTPETRVLP